MNAANRLRHFLSLSLSVHTQLKESTKAVDERHKENHAEDDVVDLPQLVVKSRTDSESLQ